MSLFLVWFYGIQGFYRGCCFGRSQAQHCECFHDIPFSLSLWLLITFRLRSLQEHQHPGRTPCLSGHRTLTWPWSSSLSTAPRGSAWPWRTSILGLRTTSPTLSILPSQAGRYHVPYNQSLWLVVCLHGCRAICVWRPEGAVKCKGCWNYKQLDLLECDSILLSPGKIISKSSASTSLVAV